MGTSDKTPSYGSPGDNKEDKADRNTADAEDELDKPLEEDPNLVNFEEQKKDSSMKKSEIEEEKEGNSFSLGIQDEA